MYIVFQELLLFIILEILKMIEGICNAFNYLFGGINISNEDNTTYILDYLFANNTLNNTFNIIILFSLLIGGILSIISLIKNMINNSKSIVTIISQFFISIILKYLASVKGKAEDIHEGKQKPGIRFSSKLWKEDSGTVSTEKRQKGCKLKNLLSSFQNLLLFSH